MAKINTFPVSSSPSFSLPSSSSYLPLCYKPFPSLSSKPHNHGHLLISSFHCQAISKAKPSLLISRRSLLLLFLSTTPPLPSFANDQIVPPPDPSPPTSLPNPPSSPPPVDTTVTDRIFLDFSLCPTSFSPDRTLGDTPDSCSDSMPLGRVVLGLYGKLLPRTVANFKAMCIGSSSSGVSYKSTLVHKVLQGQYFAAGRQSRREKGEVRPPLYLESNSETIDSRSFLLTHSRPGTLSLCLGENDDEDGIKLDPSYRNVEFLITTGPGPCPELDGQNIVFGTVLEGLDVVTTIASIPTYKPAERIRQFNDFAEFLGDERAQNARASWNRPLKTIYISDCGELKVAKPLLTPSLP